MTWAAVAIGVGGAIIGAVGANQAANTQASAAENAAGIQQGMFNQIVGNEAPFLQVGQSALGPLNYALGIGSPTPTTVGAPYGPGPGYGGRGAGEPGYGGRGTRAVGGPNIAGAQGSFGGLTFGEFNQPFTADTFQKYSPAYKFTKQQGMQGVLNSDATSASALAPPALKDLISFNSQFANESFNNAFNQYQGQNTNIFNRLYGLAGLGMQAGGASTTGAPSFAGSIGQQVANVGTAQAGGYVGATNSLTGALPWLYANNSGFGGPSSSDILNSGMGQG